MICVRGIGVKLRGKGDGLFELLVLRGGWVSGCCFFVLEVVVVVEEYGEFWFIDKVELVERIGCGDMVVFVFCVWFEGGCIMGKKIIIVSLIVIY